MTKGMIAQNFFGKVLRVLQLIEGKNKRDSDTRILANFTEYNKDRSSLIRQRQNLASPNLLLGFFNQ